MNEQEWEASSDPQAMLTYLRQWTLASDPSRWQTGSPANDRKLRLFCTACYAMSYGHRQALAEGGYAAWDNGEVDPEDAASPPSTVAQAWCQTNSPEKGEITRAQKADLLREIIGNPWHPVILDSAWLTPTVVDLATAAYADRPSRKCEKCPKWEGMEIGTGDAVQAVIDWGKRRKECVCGGAGRIEDGTLDPDRLAVLADALTDEGCDNESLLRHLRSEEVCSYCMLPDPASAEYGGGGNYWCPGCGGTEERGHGGEGWMPKRFPCVRGCAVLDAILGRS